MQNSLTPKRLHEQAISCLYKLDMGLVSEEKRTELLLEALNYEEMAALMLADRLDAEPTRGLLFRSAASIALKLKDYDKAEVLAARGITERTPLDIREELRKILEACRYNYHLSVEGYKLSDSDFQFILGTGARIQEGFAPYDEVRRRVDIITSLHKKNLERYTGKAFGNKGRATEEIERLARPFLETRAASFAVTIRFLEDNSLPFDNAGELNHVSKSIHDIGLAMQCLQDDRIDEIAEIIPDKLYRTNFLLQARDFLPDGNNISSMSINYKSGGEERHVSLRRTRKEVKIETALILGQDEFPQNVNDQEGTLIAEEKEYTGVFLDALGKDNTMRLRLSKPVNRKKLLDIKVPDTFPEIVRDRYLMDVWVLVAKKGDEYTLLDIKKVIDL